MMKMAKMIMSGLLVIALLALLPAVKIMKEAQAQAPAPEEQAPAHVMVPQSQAQMMLSFAPLVKLTAPAVVNVYASGKVREENFESPFSDDPFFRHFFGDGEESDMPRERISRSLGSGVIVDPSGIIVTNHHVIGSRTEIRIVLADKREFEAKLLLADERSDLAVLKIDVGDEKLSALKLANSDDLDVGDLVLAIGNPFGVGQTVTSGIVSALARTNLSVSDYQFFIQTDAAINPGNSGGALVNMKGELVGINTAIFSKSGGSIGIGFSIPSNMVATVIQSAKNGGKKIIRPWAGIDLQNVTPDLASSLGMARPEGALLLNLQKDSPFLKAGLQRGDVILALDGHQIESASEFGYRLATATVGQEVIVEFQRGAKPMEARVQMMAPPEGVGDRQQATVRETGPLEGVVIANISPAIASEVGLPRLLQGVTVVSPGEGRGQQYFQTGDVLVLINGQKIDKVDDVINATAAHAGIWVIQLNRGHQVLQFTLP